MKPRFSVVIPTRERPRTLSLALRTCLAQDFDDYEIVVSDNCGSPATRQVVDGFRSPRLRYVRAPQALSMSANWELGVSQAHGEYILVLGDDDGLLPYGLRELDRLITQFGARAVRWTGAFYLWPTIDLPGQANYLRIPLGREVRTIEARAAIAAAVEFRACYSTLPMMYNSAVHRDLIATLKAKAGRVFGSHYPDVYSGFALGWLAGTYVSTDVPMAVSGISGGSFGVATLYHRGKSSLDHEFRSSNFREGLPTHPWVPYLPIFPFVPVADCFQLAKEALFPTEEALCFDRRALAAHCAHAIRAEGPEDWQAALGIIRATFDDDPEAQAWFDATLGTHPFTPAPPVQLRSPHLGFDGDFLHLDTAAFGVEDVYGAAQLCAKILGYGDEEIRYGLPGHSALQAAQAAAHAAATRLQAELDQARAEVTRLSLLSHAHAPRTLRGLVSGARRLWRRPQNAANG